MGKMPSEGGGSGYADLENRPIVTFFYTSNNTLSSGSNGYTDMTSRVYKPVNPELTYKINYENIRNTGGIGTIRVRLYDKVNNETVAGPWGGGSGLEEFTAQPDAELYIQGYNDSSSYAVQVNDVWIEAQ